MAVPIARAMLGNNECSESQPLGDLFVRWEELVAEAVGQFSDHRWTPPR